MPHGIIILLHVLIEPCIDMSMELILGLLCFPKGLDSIFVVIYLDEILIASNMHEDHWYHLNQVSFVLRNEKL